MPTQKIAQNYLRVAQNVADACVAAQRSPESVLLLVVSKTHPMASVLAAYNAGARHFGENYAQEGTAKIEALDEHSPENQAIWHFIGPLQSNKSRAVAEYFDWVHSVDRLKIAQRLNEQRPVSRAPLNICLQVNIDDEASKSGCSPEEAPALALAIAALPNLHLRGLMAIPKAIDHAAPHTEQCAPFVALSQLFSQIQSQLPTAQAAHFDTLSMGMSDDYQQAISSGSTMVRIGTAIFGARAYTAQTSTTPDPKG